MEKVKERNAEHKEQERAQRDERARREDAKPGEREPKGKDDPKVSYATGKITELLLGLHNEDRPHVVEQLNKFGLLGGGESQIEKDQKEDARKRQEESDKWRKEAKFQNEKASKEALEAAEAKHKAEVATASGKPDKEKQQK